MTGVRAAFALALALTVPFSARAAAAYEVTDALGAKVEIARAPSRIVTLAPSLGELAADVAGDRLERIVGVSEYTDYPPSLKHVTSIGPYNHVNLELIASLKPDLVLATKDGNARDQIEHLRELGVPVVVVATENFSGVADSMKLVARAMGDATEGEHMAARFTEGLAKAAGKPSGRRVLLQLGDDPLIVAGKRAFLNDALTTVGAANLYGDLSEPYPRPSLEDAVSRDPDTILVLALGGDEAAFQRMAAAWARFPKLAAVKQKRVRVLRADALLRPSMRLLEGLSLLKAAINGP